jgi:hypothetical protein
MGYEISLSSLIRFVATSDEMNGDSASPREVIKGGCHSSEHDRLDEAWPLGYEYFQPLR